METIASILFSPSQGFWVFGYLGSFFIQVYGILVSHYGYKVSFFLKKFSLVFRHEFSHVNVRWYRVWNMLTKRLPGWQRRKQKKFVTDCTAPKLGALSLSNNLKKSFLGIWYSFSRQSQVIGIEDVTTFRYILDIRTYFRRSNSGALVSRYSPAGRAWLLYVMWTSWWSWCKKLKILWVQCDQRLEKADLVCNYKTVCN